MVASLLGQSVEHQTELVTDSFAFDVSTVWNPLPDEIHASPSISSFRKKLKSYLYTKGHPH